MKNILIFFCIIFSLLCYADSWKKESVKNTIPKERGSHTLTEIGSDYYLFGGCDDPRLWKFNLSDNTFTQVEKFKSDDNFTGHVALELSGKLYFLFGLKNNTTNLKIYSYNFNAKGKLEEETLDNTISNLQRKDFAGVQDDNSFYIFGGRKDDSNLVSSELAFVKLTYNNNKWEYEKISLERTDAPPLRYGHKMISHKGDFYLFGGQNGSTYYNDVWIYNPDRNEWTELSVSKGKTPSGRSFSTMAIINSELWITGGISNGEYLKDTWKFDITKKEWKQKRDAKTVHAQTESILSQLDNNIKLTIWGGKSSSSNFVSKSSIYIYDSTDRPEDDDDDDNHVHVFCGMLGIEFLGIICILTILHNLKKKP